MVGCSHSQPFLFSLFYTFLEALVKDGGKSGDGEIKEANSHNCVSHTIKAIVAAENEESIKDATILTLKPQITSSIMAGKEQIVTA